MSDTDHPKRPLPSEQRGLVRDIAAVLNLRSRENASNTPDYILAEYMVTCLDAFEAASNARQRWYGVAHVPGKVLKATIRPLKEEERLGSKEKAEDI